MLAICKLLANKKVGQKKKQTKKWFIYPPHFDFSVRFTCSLIFLLPPNGLLEVPLSLTISSLYIFFFLRSLCLSFSLFLFSSKNAVLSLTLFLSQLLCRYHSFQITPLFPHLHRQAPQSPLLRFEARGIRIRFHNNFSQPPQSTASTPPTLRRSIRCAL